MEQAKSVQARARELARSGKFVGWRSIAFELQFEEGFAEAVEWLYSPAAREELDHICEQARAHLRAREAADRAA